MLFVPDYKCVHHTTHFSPPALPGFFHAPWGFHTPHLHLLSFLPHLGICINVGHQHLLCSILSIHTYGKVKSLLCNLHFRQAPNNVAEKNVKNPACIDQLPTFAYMPTRELQTNMLVSNTTLRTCLPDFKSAAIVQAAYLVVHLYGLSWFPLFGILYAEIMMKAYDLVTLVNTPIASGNLP
eukprot:TRINITY_DN4110_c0_g1_i1.p1 TRINITY_DN4110_c0_g1~~TRINITY_DN4110_c0_g1_i1.p1  ORF type:complete len:181 (+),score=16.20 TRINITY_DN4110_c0_g1_i1:333-875(+)